MKVLLLGSGGRESALAWKMNQSPLLDKLYIAPGNGGTEAFGTNVGIAPTDFEALAEFAAREGIDLIVAGNEDPLVAGLADFFKAKGGPAVCGPCKAGAALEGRLRQTLHGSQRNTYRPLPLVHGRHHRGRFPLS